VAEYASDAVRNVVLIGHADAGKTILTDAMLHTAKVINRMGSIAEGTTTSDYHKDEIERQSSITASLINYEWKQTKVNCLDTPGYSDFSGEPKSALAVSDCALLTINADSGVEVGTEVVWKYCEDLNLPRIIVVNKLDHEELDYDAVVGAIQERFGSKIAVVSFPVSTGAGFSQVIDLLDMKLYNYEKDATGACMPQDIPADLKDTAAALREQLIEKVAEVDDALIEKYLEEGELTDEELVEGLKAGVANSAIMPVAAISAGNNIGVSKLMDLIVKYAPTAAARGEAKGTNPASGDEVSRPITDDQATSAFVFKSVEELHVGELSYFKVLSGTVSSGMDLYNARTKNTERFGTLYLLCGRDRNEIAHLHAGDIGAAVKLKATHTNDTLYDKKAPIVYPEISFPPPVIRSAIEPKTRGDEEKISSGLTHLQNEDPSFHAEYDPELRQMIISGQGELHLNIVVKRLQEKFGVEVEMIQPKIPYRETIKGTWKGQGKFKRQSGGRGQYGDTWISIEPVKRGEGFEFVDAIVGGSIPGKFIPAVEKGVREVMEEGILAGCKVVDVKVTLYDGSFHNVDSSEMAFKIAASQGFKKGFVEAKPSLLEPIYDVEVIVPEDYMGDVMGDLSSRRGKISGMDADGPFQVIKAKVPLAELYKYSTSLRSMTHGRGIHRRKFSHYEDTPHDVQAKVIEAYKEAREQKE
jgi:elongation factor G